MWLMLYMLERNVVNMELIGSKGDRSILFYILFVVGRVNKYR